MDYVRRPSYENQIKALRDTEDIKVLTGVRRCGKSMLLQWLRQDLINSNIPDCNVFYRRMDMFGMPINPNAEWLAGELTDALSNADVTNSFYVLLDEVQDVAGWERVARQLHTRPNTDVYITGSNAYVLSSDLATLIGGRYVEIKVQPLSFPEYLEFAKHYKMEFSETSQAFSEYLRFGGMPALFHLKERNQQEIAQLLKTVYETVILNDVAARTGIGDIDLLSKIVRYVFSTSGSLLSSNKIANTLTSAGRKTRYETIDGYIKALVDALILYECEQEGIAGKELLRPRKKFYPVDTGLRNLARNFAPGDTGFQLENAVHNELVRRGWNATVGSLRAGEVDFVAKNAEGTQYIQVTESMTDPAVYAREIAPFERIHDSWPKIVLTADRLNCGTTEDGIRIVNIMDWMMEEEE